MEEVADLILKELSVSPGPINSLKVASKLELDHQKVVGAIKSLESFPHVIGSQQKSDLKWSLTEEGEGFVKEGSHEAILFHKVPQEGSIKQSQLMASVGGVVGKVGFSKAMSLGWIGVDKKDEGGPRVSRKVKEVEDRSQKLCEQVSMGKMDGVSEAQRNELKKRKLITEVKVVYYEVSKGDKFTLKIVKQETELSQEMIHSGAWKNKEFKKYNFASKGLLKPGGHLHPLLKVRTQFRQIFLEMGFTEMATNNFVESSFWNFDALFQPQQHPARDAHDTFFISDPSKAGDFPVEYLQRVKKVHSEGGYGSIGYKYQWSTEEASKNILRTHTTGVSARMLHRLATMQGGFKASKFFSIDRVFRNESLDATHLAEFHQIEGMVADYNLTLAHLMTYIERFFQKYGISKLKFKPAYNPYTEPSMEIFSYHQGLKKWVEIGNSGVFRPEMLLPMGLPADVAVIAWGLSLERPTMIKYGISNIRDLFGPRIDLQTVYSSPLCRLGA